MLNHSMRLLFAMLFAITLCACSSNPKTVDANKVEKPKALSTLQKTDYSFAKLWSASSGALNGKYAELLVPVWDQDALYLAAENGMVEALDLTTGKTLWRQNLKNKISAGLGGDIYNIYLVTTDAELVALNKKNGKQEWSTQLQSAVLATPVSNNLVVITHAVDGKISGFDPYSGNSYWVHQEVSPEFSIRGNATPVFFDNQWAVVGLDNGKVIALRTQQGGLVWEKKINQSAARLGNAAITDVDLPIVYTKESFFISTQSKELLSINKETGQFQWQGKYDEAIKYVTVFGDKIAVVTQSDKVFCHDATSGELRWSSDKLQYRKLNQPALDDDNIYVVDAEGVLHVFSIMSGDIVGRKQIGLKMTRNPVHLSGNTIFAVDDAGKVETYKLTTAQHSSKNLQKNTSSISISPVAKTEVLDAKISETKTQQADMLGTTTLEIKTPAIQTVDKDVLEKETLKIQPQGIDSSKIETLQTEIPKNAEAAEKALDNSAAKNIPIVEFDTKALDETLLSEPASSPNTNTQSSE